MSSQITFTSARLLSFGRNQNIGTAQFTSSWNMRVSKAMAWGDECPAWEKKAALDGELHAVQMTLTPSEEQLRKHAVDIDISLVYGFEAVRLELEGSSGKGFRTEVRFKVDFPDSRGCQQLERYIMTIGDGKGSLAVSYTPQEKLDLAEAPEQGNLEERVSEIAGKIAEKRGKAN